MIAADFLGHTDPKITQSYYNKAGTSQRLALAQPLATSLDTSSNPDSLLNLKNYYLSILPSLVCYVDLASMFHVYNKPGLEPFNLQQ